MPTLASLDIQEFLGPNTKGSVYFVRAGDSGPIKIGFTSASDPSSRIAGLQTVHHEELTLLAYLGGDREGEAALHAEFRHLHIRGEWFRPGPDLLEFIEEINTRVLAMDQRIQAEMASVADMQPCPV